MTQSAVLLEVLPAAYGDSLLVTCNSAMGAWRMLVDTGTDECWPSLKARLAALPVDPTGHRHIDLAVITHIDHDHIGAAGELFSDTSLKLTFGDVWFNAPTMPASRGVAEGQSLARLLGASKASLPWNKAWGGRHAVTTEDAAFIEMPHTPGAPQITLLSPTPATLEAIFKVWDAEMHKLRERAVPEPAPASARGALDLDALASKLTPVDHAPANGSSIAFLLEHRGVSLLLGADMHPTVAVPALKALAAHRGLALPLQVDAFKVSHHGSRANVSNDLLQAVQASHYVISTNGAIFGHPNDEAIARLIVHGGARRRIWFNFRTDHTEKWGGDQLQHQHGYSVVYPESPAGGVAIALDARPTH
jgi:beta-lactamase superfamily II metal-dependent hydrolase